MNTKQKKVLYNLFYEEFQMPDKMLYIKRVMDSCKTNTQLESARTWGHKVLWKYYDVMKKRLDRYESWTALSMSFKMIDMTEALVKEIDNYLK